MKRLKFWRVIILLLSLGISVSLNLLTPFSPENGPRTEDRRPVTTRPNPPDRIISDYAYIPFETMLKEAGVIVAGKVTAISETRWNQDSGQYWEENFKDGDYETTITALPYYEISLSVDKLLADSLGLTDSQLIITVIGSSPVDHPAEASPIHPKTGDDIVAFIRPGEIGWRSGPITYNKDEGSWETGRKVALLLEPIRKLAGRAPAPGQATAWEPSLLRFSDRPLMGGPDNSHLLRNENGLYYRPSAAKPYSGVEEQDNPISLEDLAKLVQDKRAQ